ncbi:hypothetical protein GCWU000325_02095 [Alloprevotella tannerae ATCC 51259]|uniref:Uncharacterized protein n=1 Tax=Alloprevotella tannerae ATCC 51259 TaxID=626522 RepID=C9LIN6_9BACT|nr:hypothetical protein GCWU000325_02095 [Alloprevotella tannerae ATCC 51259]
MNAHELTQKSTHPAPFFCLPAAVFDGNLLTLQANNILYV